MNVEQLLAKIIRDSGATDPDRILLMSRISANYLQLMSQKVSGIDVTQELAIVEASVSRLRPVMLAAITTILGMAPLLTDAFFKSMAVTIMGGLAFATILTMVAAPVFYMIFFARDEKREAKEAAA